MARNLLVATNPSRRRRKQTPKQRAASLRNLRKARSARSGPRKRRRNPSRTTTTAARRAPARRRSTRRRALPRRRNPARIIPRSFVDRQVMPALIGGGGAVANDVAYNVILNLIPAGMGGGIVDQFRSGYLRHVGKAASALLLAWGAGMVVKRRTADQLGAGALTVVGYNVVRDVMATVAPQLPLGDMGAYIPPTGLGYAGAGYAPPGTLNQRHGSNFTHGTGLAAYVSPRLRGLGNAQRFGVPRQLAQPRPYTPAMPSAAVSEAYTEDYSG